MRALLTCFGFIQTFRVDLITGILLAKPRRRTFSFPQRCDSVWKTASDYRSVTSNLYGTIVPSAEQTRSISVTNIMTTDDDALKSLTSEVTLHIGNRAELANLFSYPNRPSHECLSDTIAINDDHDGSNRCDGEIREQQQDIETMSLENTIQYYLMTSILRDGHAESKIQISTEKDDSNSLYATISGNAAIPYSRAIPKFLQIAQLGLQACQQVQVDGLWRDGWRFFLPLGLPLTQHWTIELLHFPPIYTLEEDQDYLASRSTQRWRQLLEINHSDDPLHTTVGTDSEIVKGDRYIESTDRFQAIIDIVPIAAPSSDGKNMKDVYPYFEEYIRASLQFWGSNDQGGNAHNTKPIVAFGWPVKCWVETNQAPDLHYKNVEPAIQDKKEEENQSNSLPLGVLSLTRLPIGSDNHGCSAPVLIANHPSYLYNAGRRMVSNRIESLGDEDCSLLEKIMTEDLIAARWQARMGLNPSQDAHCVLQECCGFWRDASRIDRIRQLINNQAFVLQDI